MATIFRQYVRTEIFKVCSHQLLLVSQNFVRMFTANPIFIKPVYYPIGNTSAAFLLQSLPPEQDASVLLMGCGDPRHILFTAYNVQDDGSRSVDFTCCDMQPAILARNILLLSLIIDDRDGKNSSKYWGIFYHLLIDNDSLSIVRDQARKLMKLAKTIDTWHESTYGSTLRMVSQDTLGQLRSFWQKYFETAGSNKHQASITKFHEGWRRAEREILESSRLMGVRNANGSRALGPLSPVIDLEIVCLQLERFWSTGVAGGNSFDEATAKNSNPMFLYTSFGDEFCLNKDQDPILGFHLELAHSQVLKNGPFGEALGLGSPATTRQKVLDRAVQVAKAQFKEWSNAFYSMALRNKIIVRFHLGDALRLCRALEICREKGPDAASFDYTQGWRAAPLKLDGGDYEASSLSPAPMSFDVIETSNMADHVGLLNLLIAATSVLSSKPSSILYTETFNGRQKTQSLELIEMLCGDVVTMSLLLGVAPTGYVAGTVPDSCTQERVHSGVGSTNVRISWKQPMLGDETALDGGRGEPRCTVSAEELAMVLFQVYRMMFMTENSRMHQENIRGHYGYMWYTRETYAEFLRLVKRRVDTDWSHCMETLLNKIIREDFSDMGVGKGGSLGLLLSLHESGVYIGTKKELAVIAYPLPPTSFWPGTLPEPVMPEAITIVLIAPRSSMGDLYLNRPSMALCAAIKIPNIVYMTASIQTVFGRLIRSKDGLKGTIEEDINARDLIVSFSIPRNILSYKHPSSIDVAFYVMPMIFNRPIEERKHLFPSYSAWIVYESTLTNKGEVAVFREPPGILHRRPVLETPRLPSPSTIPTNPKHHVSDLKVYFDKESKVEKFQVYLSYEYDTAESQALVSGSEPTIIQNSPCTVDIIIPGCTPQNLAFPYPVDTSRAEFLVRPMRSFLFALPGIELSLPPSRPTDKAGFNLRVLQTVNTSPPIVWDMPRVSLDRLPILDTECYQDMHWLPVHLSCMYSDRERQVHSQDEEATKSNLKTSISSILLNASGTLEKGKKYRVFAISSPSDNKSRILIFVSNIRLDFGSRTVVADARVLPLTEYIASSEEKALKILEREGIFQLVVGEAELESWKEILPTLVERCREWKHDLFCEYPEHGIPVSVDAGVSPLCSCGVGKAPQTTLEVEEWKPFEKYWTRAAIAPIFAFPYGESCDETIEGFKDFKSALKVQKDARVPSSDKRVLGVDRKPSTTPKKYVQVSKVKEKAATVGGKVVGAATTAEIPVGPGVCQNCKRKPATGVMVFCKQCRKIGYCSVACMKTDRGRHKRVCKK